MTTQPGRRLAEEQAALRRVATLVARGRRPRRFSTRWPRRPGVCCMLTACGWPGTSPTAPSGVVPAWTSAGAAGPIPVGTRVSIGGRNVITLLFQAWPAGPHRRLRRRHGPGRDLVRESGLRAAVGVPVSVERRLWGLMGVASMPGPLPGGTEARLAGFTELAATAIANAEARLELRGFAEEQAALRRVAVLVARGRCRRSCSPRSPRRPGGCWAPTSRAWSGMTRTVPGRSSERGAAPAPPCPSRLAPGSAPATGPSPRWYPRLAGWPHRRLRPSLGPAPTSHASSASAHRLACRSASKAGCGRDGRGVHG